MDYIYVVPCFEGVSNSLVRLVVVLFQIGERLVGKDHAPAECVVGSISFKNRDPMARILFLHEDGEVESRWSAPDYVYSHCVLNVADQILEHRRKVTSPVCGCILRPC